MFMMRSVVAAGLLLAFVSVSSAQNIVVDNTSSGFASRTGIAVPIFMYHGLDSPFGYNSADFVAQMDWLKNNGFNTITLDHYRSWAQTGSPALPPKPIILTFDDNYLSIYTVAFPTLQARGFTGVNYAHTHYVGVMTSYDHADWNECTEMEQAGVIFTESHTVMHQNLTTLSTAAMDAELINSKNAIQTNIPGKVCKHLAYPYGGYNATVIARTQAAGYQTATTTLSGVNVRTTPLYELRRYGINPNTAPATFQSSANAGLGSGAWATSNSEPAPYGTNYATAPAGTGHSQAIWSFTVPANGSYEVSAWWTSHSNRATNAPYTVFHAGGQTTVQVNQQQNGGQWNTIGQFTFQAGKTYFVTLNDHANGVVVADAIRVQSLPSAAADWTLYE
jgi:peptidoglycan/xylan/chitin deacetylase (PgdA/CDA1 family)